MTKWKFIEHGHKALLIKQQINSYIIELKTKYILCIVQTVIIFFFKSEWNEKEKLKDRMKDDDNNKMHHTLSHRIELDRCDHELDNRLIFVKKKRNRRNTENSFSFFYTARPFAVLFIYFFYILCHSVVSLIFCFLSSLFYVIFLSHCLIYDLYRLTYTIDV